MVRVTPAVASWRNAMPFKLATKGAAEFLSACIRPQNIDQAGASVEISLRKVVA